MLLKSWPTLHLAPKNYKGEMAFQLEFIGNIHT